jgi:hypothetical protein
MSPVLLNPFSWFGLLVALWAIWRLATWLASGGQLPLKGRRGSAGSFAGAGLAAQMVYQPGVRQAMEARFDGAIRRENDDEGDPPQPDDGPGGPSGRYNSQEETADELPAVAAGQYPCSR